MKKLSFSLAFMLAGLFTYAESTNNVAIEEPEVMLVVAEKLASYEVDHPLLRNVSISIPENALNNEELCGFTLSYDDGFSSWSTWYDCGGMTMDEIWNFLLVLLTW